MRHADRGAPRRRSGFALVVVIWGLGVITLLVVSFMSTARGRLQTAVNIAGATQANLVAEGVVNAATLSLLAERGNLQGRAATPGQKPVHDGTPQLCGMDGAVVSVSIEDESGKVDLNSATQQLLSTLFASFGAPNADGIARAIIQFRTVPTTNIAQKAPEYEASGRPFGPKRAPFQTVLELDQVIGIESAVFQSVRPFVTVHSRTTGIDAESAAPALFAALSQFPTAQVRNLTSAPFPNQLNRRDPRFPAQFNQAGAHNAFLVHTEVLMPTGQMSVSETVVELGSGGKEAFTIYEIRNSTSRYRENLQAAMQGGAPPLRPC